VHSMLDLNFKVTPIVNRGNFKSCITGGSGFGSMECFVIIKCTTFGQSILRKIIKIVPDPAGGAYIAPHTL